MQYAGAAKLIKNIIKSYRIWRMVRLFKNEAKLPSEQTAVRYTYTNDWYEPFRNKNALIFFC